MTINRKEIKTDTMALVNRATEIHNRNEKAYSYSKSVERKAKRKEELRTKLLLAAIGVPMLASGIVFGVMGVTNTIKADIITEPTEIITTETTTSRTETAVLVDIDSETGDYILQTEDGNLWGVSDPEEIYFELEFSSNGNEIEDDTIIGVEIMK